MGNANVKWMALSLIAFGCGGSSAAAPAANTANEVKESSRSAAGPSNPVSKRGSGSVSARLGPGGGSLELAEGPKVVVPTGVVEGGHDYVLKIAQKTTAFSNKESEKALGPTFSFAPDIDGSIEVSYPLASLPDGWGDPSIAYEVSEGEGSSLGEDSTRTKWMYERASLNAGRVVAKLDQATGLRMQFVLTNLEAQ